MGFNETQSTYKMCASIAKKCFVHTPASDNRKLVFVYLNVLYEIPVGYANKALVCFFFLLNASYVQIENEQIRGCGANLSHRFHFESSLILASFIEFIVCVFDFRRLLPLFVVRMQLFCGRIRNRTYFYHILLMQQMNIYRVRTISSILIHKNYFVEIEFSV